ncbi:MAG: DUF6498-containing protein [Luteolibacter sp.]
MENRHPLPANASLIFLGTANLLPAIGVLLWDWSVFEIVSLYWLENVVIGAVNVLKILTCSPDPNLIGASDAFLRESPDMPAHLRSPAASNGLHHGVKLFLIPFITVHYGMFCFVHGIFVFTLLGGSGGRIISGGPFSGMGKMLSQVFVSGGKWFVVAIVASHLFSFFFNYLGKGEYRRTSPPQLMMSPYGRIFILHVAILLGAFLILALGSPVSLLILLIAGKIALDVKLHRRSHARAAVSGTA